MIVRRILVALAIGAVLAAGLTTVASAAVPRGMTPAEYRALMIRSEGLNKLYGNAVTRLSTKDFIALWNAGASHMTPAEFNALVVRSEGLDKLYGNALTRLSPKTFAELYKNGGWRMSPEQLNALVVRSEGMTQQAKQAQIAASKPTAVTATSFAWDDFGIGMAAAFGIVLLAGGLAIAGRTGTRRRIGVPS